MPTGDISFCGRLNFAYRYKDRYLAGKACEEIEFLNSEEARVEREGNRLKERL